MFELKPYTRKNNGVYYNPFQTMDEFERNFFNPSFFETTLEQFKTDIKDDGDSYTLQADLPGFDKKDIHLDLNNDVLTISAERHSEHEDKDKKGKFVRCERSYGTYTRQFDVSNIKTQFVPQENKCPEAFASGLFLYLSILLCSISCGLPPSGKP